MYLVYLSSRGALRTPFGWLYKSFGALSRYLAILFVDSKSWLEDQAGLERLETIGATYFLDQVIPTGKTLGTGSYGSVLEVSGEF